MDALRRISCFVAAVDGGSIAAGGRRLGISASAASQNIARLESELGARLLRRTTRQLALTESGTAYYQRVRTLLGELEDAQAAVLAVNERPQGRLRIASSVTFGRHVLTAILTDFLAAYPDIAVELVLEDGLVDHLQAQIDVSIRYDAQLETGLSSVPLGRSAFVYGAAPDYLQRLGTPKNPADLTGHTALLFRSPTDEAVRPWRLARQGQQVQATFGHTLVANDGDALTQLAVTGAGIARLPGFVAEPLFARGVLHPLFRTQANPARDWVDLGGLEYHACFQSRRDVTPKLRVLLDLLRREVPRYLESPARRHSTGVTGSRSAHAAGSRAKAVRR